MAGLEKIVRPFQTDSISPPKLVPRVATTSSAQITRQTWGRGGSPKVVQGNYSLNFTVYVVHKPREMTQAPVSSGGTSINKPSGASSQARS